MKIWVLLAILVLLGASSCQTPEGSSGNESADMQSQEPQADYQIEVDSMPATHSGHGDRPTQLTVISTVEGEVVERQTMEFPPGWDVWKRDEERNVVYMKGHDGRWGAIPSNGIQEVSLATGEARTVVSKIVNTFPCDASRLAAVIRPPDGEGERRGFYDADFDLVVIDVKPAHPLEIHHVATSDIYSRYHTESDVFWDAATLDELKEVEQQYFRWSDDCTQLHYVTDGEGDALSTIELSR